MEAMPAADPPRVAFFTDSFHEVNGVALTSRHFDAFARRRGLPFLSVHAGPRTVFTEDGPVWTFELKRGFARVGLDRGLYFDPFLLRHAPAVVAATRRFRPSVIHFTGPGDMGCLAVLTAIALGVPLAGSWHTNLHEFAAQRLENLLAFLPTPARTVAGKMASAASLAIALSFYKFARVCLAPNPELIALLERGTARPTFLMLRGADSALFHPAKREPGARPFTLGFTGRLQAEKNVRFLATLERSLLDAGYRDYRFLIVGDGGEKAWLQRNLRYAEFPGVLTGEPLARAYANMDVFVFPSRTDTFGNVILEAMASGVPVVVTADGGPKFLVRSGVDGFIAAEDESFAHCVRRLYDDRELRENMSAAARRHATSLRWDHTFEQVYAAYGACFPSPKTVALRSSFPQPTNRPRIAYSSDFPKT